MAEQTLSEGDDEKIVEAFEHFEATVGGQTHARLHREIETLASKYLGIAVH